MPRRARSAQHGLLPPLRYQTRQRGLHAGDLPVVKRKEEQAHGAYRTKRVLLDIYNAMLQAMEPDTVYYTRLDPIGGSIVAIGRQQQRRMGLLHGLG